MFNHQQSVDYGFSLFPRLIGLCLSASWLQRALSSGQLFFGAGNSENCLNQFFAKLEVSSAGSISILTTSFWA
ncbi:hypothetical protein RAL73_003446 [Vibrio cholerae]|nr:hypothetical protein [Vibrio cholerae]